MAIKFLSDISLEGGQIKDFAIERLASNPSGTQPEGRIYYNTGDDTLRYNTGSGFLTLSTSAGSMSSWDLSVDDGTAVSVSDSQTVNFNSGTGITVSQSTRDITIALRAATSSVIGGIELFSDTVQSVAANSVTTTAGRTYGIQVNSAGQAVVNVPWTDSENYSFDLAGDSGSSSIASGGTATIAGGTGITTAESDGTVTVTNSKPFDSLTLAATSGSNSTIANSGTITLAAGTGITTTNNGSGQVTIAASNNGTMSSFNVADDSEDSFTISNGETVGLVGAANGGISTSVDGVNEEVDFSMDVNDLLATTTWDSAADYFAVADGTATRKILSSNIPINDFGTADGNIAMGTNKITGLGTPTANADAATKQYVDNAVVGGLQFKGSFNATTGAISGGGNLTSGNDRVAIEIGDLYIVSTAGNFFGNAATPLTIGDQVYAQADANAGASTESDFAVVQSDTDLATATAVGLASFPTAGGLVVSSGAVSLKDQSGISAGEFGSASQTVTATVDAHGILTALTEQTISITSSNVSNFASAVDTRIALQNNANTGEGTGTSITFAHGLGTADLIVQLYDISGSNEELVYADISVNSTNIIVTFGKSQTLSNYRIVCQEVSENS